MNKKQSTVFGALILGLLLAVGVESVTTGLDNSEMRVIRGEDQTLVAKLPIKIGDDGPPVKSLS